MKEQKSASEHAAKVTGFGSGSETAETEHRESATVSAEERTEIDLEERNREKRYGPRTHQDTRITSKEGTDPDEVDPLRQS